MAKQQVVVPDIGGAEDAEVIELLVGVGDEVALEQSLIVLESDKASMEIPSTVAGIVVELLVSEGQELSEGAPIVVIEVAGAVEESASGASDDPVVEPPGDAPIESEGEGEGEAVKAQIEDAPAEPEPVAGQERTVNVPDIGSDEPVELIEIYVAVGDMIAEGDSLVVLESDKASMEIPAPYAGQVLKILVAEGDNVKQGDDLVLVLSAASETESSAAAVETPAPAPAASVEVATAAANTTASGKVSAAVSGDSKSAYAGPAVRKLAREFGLNLGEINGSGPRGRVMKEDLHAFVQKSLQGGSAGMAVAGTGIPPIPQIDFAAFGEVESQSLSKMAKVTAVNMQRSWLNVPHVTQFDDADITELEVFRKGLKAEAESRGTRLTPMPFILKACAVALKDNPKFCTALSGDGQSLIYKKYIHIAMAVDTPAGLLVPVIRDVDKKSLWELAEEVIEVATKARDRKLRPDDMRGACFTISSLGNIGGRGFTPIVNAPEVGILGVSKADIRPQWNGEEFKPRNMLPLALSYDHRVINGGDAGRFLTQLVSLLSDIRRLVL